MFDIQADLERELRIREALIQEVHHRVKNNMQTINSLLRMQARKTDNKEVKDALTDARSRIQAMSIVHDKLSYTTQENVKVMDLIETIAYETKYAYVGDSPNYTVSIIGSAGICNSSQATSMALIIAEIVQNCFKHGFKERNHGALEIELILTPDYFTAIIEDDGCGLPENFSLRNTESMGISLIKTLVEDDLNGTLSILPPSSKEGACFQLQVPRQN
ncbi:MAG: sensor histidine kinase [Anaerotardibacter sp.]